MQTLTLNKSKLKLTFAVLFFALTPGLIAVLSLCFGSIALITWGQFLTTPLVLAMCHSLSILWVLNYQKGIGLTLKLFVALAAVVFVHATATSVGNYQTDFPAFSNIVQFHATFTIPSVVLIGVMAFVAQPYIRIDSLSSTTKLAMRHTILGLFVATATTACVITYLTAINYSNVDQFLLAHLAFGGCAITCVWCILSRQLAFLRYTVLVMTIAGLLFTTIILFVFRIDACMDALVIVLYMLWLLGFILVERCLGFRLSN